MKLTLLALSAVAALVFALGSRYTVFGAGSEASAPSTAVFGVRRDKLTTTVTESGYLKAKNSLKIRPKFRREGTITWLIEEGEEVQAEDVLIEFDKTELNNQISELESQLIQHEMELEAARAELGIQERDNEAATEKGNLALEVAELVLERYEKGEAPNELRKLKLGAEKASSEFSRAKERFEQVPQLAEEGFLTKIQVEEERIRLREAEINEENAQRELELYQTYTFRMEMTQKGSGVKDARRELENTQVKARINLKQKQAQVAQGERQVEANKARLEQLRQELANMTLKADQPGTVHYGDPNRPWMHDEIKVGNRLRQGNTAITLPDLSVMQVVIQVHEADIDQVSLDLPVFVTVETHKDKTFPGKVTEISSVASSQGWSDNSNRTFRVEITMEPHEGELRAGVTAKAQIQVAEIPDVLQVPIHAVISEGGKRFCFVKTEADLERREISVGKNNAHFVVITEGLAEGEQVLLYDPREGGLPGSGETDQAPEEEAELSADLAGMEGSG